MDSGLSLLANAVEIAFAATVTTAAFGFFRHKGNTVAEAGAYALMAMLMLHSWFAQVLLFFGGQRVFSWGQLLMAAAALMVIRRHRRLLLDQWAVSRHFARAHWAPVGSMVLAWGYLAAVWVWRVGHGHVPDAGSGADVWQRGLFEAAAATGPQPAIPVLNHAILLAPWQPALAPGIVNLAAYIVIALATYALARRYAWPPTAITVSLLVISMPRLAHQSLLPYSELLPAAAVLLSILALYRTLEQPRGRDAAMLICAIAFAVADGRLCYAMPAVLALLSLLVLSRRHDIRLWPQAMRRHVSATMVTVALALVFSQVLVVGFNVETGASWIGERMDEAVAFNNDRLPGMAANVVRYLLQAIHFPEIVDRIGRQALGISGLTGLQRFYETLIAPVFGDKGAAAVFELSWGAREGGGWFGPVGFLLVIPSLINAFRRGPHRLKTTALALWVYWVLIALVAAWQPYNVRLMTPFFVGAGFTMAFSLPPWRLGRKGRLMLQLFGIVMLAGDMIS